MRVIGLEVRKGGVGKTTICVNFAHILSVSGYRVLLIDLDDQGNLTDTYMNGLKFEQPDFSVLLTTQIPNKEILYSNYIYKSNVENISIIPANDYLEYIGSNVAKISETNPMVYYSLRKNLSLVEDDFDYVIIDNSAGCIGLDECSIFTCDEILAPIKDDGYSYKGVLKTLTRIKELKQRYSLPFNFRGMFFNGVKGHTSSSKDMFEGYMRTFPGFFIPVYIRETNAFSKASTEFKPLLLHNKRSDAVDDYIKLLRNLGYIDVTHNRTLEKFLRSRRKYTNEE